MVSLLHEPDSFLDQVWMFLGEVVRFTNILAEIVEGDFACEHGLANGFPIAKAYGLATALFVEFPVQVIVGLLLVTLAEQRW